MPREIDPRDCQHGWSDSQQEYIDKLHAELAQERSDRQKEHDLRVKFAGEIESLQAELNSAHAALIDSGDLAQNLSDENAKLKAELAEAKETLATYCLDCRKVDPSDMLERAEKAEAERDEISTLRDKLGKILTATANALKGQPDELSLHSWHDLANVATKLVSERDAIANKLEDAKAALKMIADRETDYPSYHAKTALKELED